MLKNQKESSLNPTTLKVLFNLYTAEFPHSHRLTTVHGQWLTLLHVKVVALFVNLIWNIRGKIKKNKLRIITEIL